MSIPRSLAALLPAVARKAGAPGPLGALTAAWERVVGRDWAARAQPVALTFPRGRRDGATLKLRVDPADAILLQHDSAALIDRINGHFGYAAIARIALVQAPLARPAAAPRRGVTAAEAAAIDAALAPVEDEAWRARLARLGRAVYARTAGRDTAGDRPRQEAS